MRLIHCSYQFRVSHTYHKYSRVSSTSLSHQPIVETTTITHSFLYCCILYLGTFIKMVSRFSSTMLYQLAVATEHGNSDQRHLHYIGCLYLKKGKKFIGFSPLPDKTIIVWRQEKGRTFLCCR